MVKLLRKIKIDHNDVIFWEGDNAEEIYFIRSGKVKLIDSNGNAFKYYNNGDNLGLFEAVLSIKRQARAVAIIDSVFYCLSKSDLDRELIRNKNMRNSLIKHANEDKKEIEKLKIEMITYQPIYGRNHMRVPTRRESMLNH